MANQAPKNPKLKRLRAVLWVLVAAAALAAIGLLFWSGPRASGKRGSDTAQKQFGGPFTLVDANGQPFSSARLEGKPHLMFFGFTRCGDVCPTTLARLTRLRDQAGGPAAMNIVFVTIDPAHDGPREVGQYAQLFNSPIIGLTGTQQQIDAVKRQYGIYAEPMPHAAAGQEMAHTGTVLVFDRAGGFVGTITPDEPDASALATLKALR